MSATLSPREIANTILEGVIEEQANDPDLWSASLVCGGCGREAEVWAEGLDGIEALIDHCLFEHGMREDLRIQRSATLLSAYELAETVGLPPATNHEERWREGRN